MKRFSMKILIVEDEEMIREGISDHLLLQRFHNHNPSNSH